jgi:hypothetical protein
MKPRGSWSGLLRPAADSFPTGCIVAGPLDKLCRYTLYVMAGVAEPLEHPPNSTAATAGAGASSQPIPTRWEYRVNITDPKAFGAEARASHSSPS